MAKGLYNVLDNFAFIWFLISIPFIPLSFFCVGSLPRTIRFEFSTSTLSMPSHVSTSSPSDDPSYEESQPLEQDKWLDLPFK